jgi:hypothetical protein
MQTLIRSLLVVVGLGLYAVSNAADVAATAVTDSGRKVILYKDGTWKDAPAVSSTVPGTVPKSSTEKASEPKGLLTVWFDPKKWSKLPESKQLSTAASLSFIHKNGEGYAMVIAERIPAPLETLKTVALDNAKKVAPDAKVVVDQKQNINGTDVTVMDIAGTIQGIPFRYHGVYWTGEKGSVQVITYTSQNIFDEYKADFDTFLGGVVLATK